MRNLTYPLLVALLLFSCSTGSEQANAETQDTSFQNTRWVLKELAGLASITSESEPFIRFPSDQANLTGNAGCNTFFGSYEVTENTLTMGPLGVTQMMCADMRVENVLLQLLEQVTRYKISGDLLVFYAEDEKVATFEDGGISK